LSPWRCRRAVASVGIRAETSENVVSSTESTSQVGQALMTSAIASDLAIATA